MDNLMLSTVILTHTHHDHTQNVRSFKDAYKCDIIVHKSEADYLREGGSVYKVGKKERYVRNYTPVGSDIQINKKYDLSKYGLDAYILHTPGHSNGSVSIIVDNEIAIIGDALGGIEKKPFEKTFKRVSEDIKGSWETLIDLKCSLYLPAHKYQSLKYNDFVELYKKYLIETNS